MSDIFLLVSKWLMLFALIPVAGLAWILLVTHIDNYFFNGRGQDWLDNWNSRE